MRYAVIRTDASTNIGIGHVMRCLTLATALRTRGFVVRFVCREHVGHLCDLIEQRGFAVARLAAATAVSSAHGTQPVTQWLGMAWQDDAQQTSDAIEAGGVVPEWLIVDHYALARDWENALRVHVQRILVIDDLADRTHDCDLLLDQNLVSHMDTRYEGRVPGDCRLLLGPQYALLQQIYSELHEDAAIRAGEIRRILIFFGGADNDNLTGRSVRAFLRLNRPDIQVDVVITQAMTHAAAVREQVAGHGNILLHSALPTLAYLMAQADVAIGACGSTSWERLSLGLPTIVITLADNQRPMAEALHAAGLVRWLGHQDCVDEGALALALADLVGEGLDSGWSSGCLAAVDARGTSRVVTALALDADTPLQARPATIADEALLLAWANDPLTRRNAFNSDPIGIEEHRRWFRARLVAAQSCRLYIVQTGEAVAVGQVRFDWQDDDTWSIDYALAPQFRGQGCGVILLQAALTQMRIDTHGARVRGHVKPANRASCRVFESLGFARRSGGDGIVEYSLAL